MIIEGEPLLGKWNQFINDYNEGMLIKDIVSKYNISRNRLHRLINEYEVEGLITNNRKGCYYRNNDIRVYKSKNGMYTYRYYTAEDKRKTITSRDLTQLKYKVLSQGLQWVELDS